MADRAQLEAWIAETQRNQQRLRKWIARELCSPNRRAERVRHHLEEQPAILADVLVSKVNVGGRAGDLRWRWYRDPGFIRHESAQ